MMVHKPTTFLVFLSALLLCQIGFAQASVKTNKTYITKNADQSIIIHYFKKDKELKTRLIAYNAELYSQAYKTFLANQNIADAYVIAIAAVTQKPNDLLWRERLVKVARWNNLPKIALQNAIYLARKNDVKSLVTAITIAKQLNDHAVLSELYQIQIKLKAADPQAWEGLIKSEESLGNPEKAIKHLQLAIQKEPKLFYYLQLANLYQNIGDIKAEENTLKAAKQKFGASTGIAMRQAELLYSRGDIKKAHKEILTAINVAKRTDYAYWRTLGQLAWSSYDLKHALIAYKQLERSNKLNETDLINLIRILEKTNVDKAFKLSLNGWHRYQSDFFLISLLNLTPQTKKWDTLAKILANLPRQTKERLMKNPYYIATEARMWGELGNFQTALNLYQKALRQFPESANLKYDYLWFLIDYNQKEALAWQLGQWNNIILRTAKLLQPAAAGYMLLGKPNIALKIYQREYANKKNDYVWLVTLADALDAADKHVIAAQIRQRAWRLALKRITSQRKPLTLEELTNYGTLAMQESPNKDLTQRIMARLADNYSNNATKSLLTTWALDNDNDDLAGYIWHFYGDNEKPPLWAQQTIALHNNNRSQLQKLLYNPAAKLPYRDSATAAGKINNERMAQDLVYRGLVEHPQDGEMYDIFTETMLKSADRVGIKQFYQQSGYVVGPRTVIDADWFITPRTSISPFVSIWKVRSTDESQILTPMNYDRSVGLKVKSLYKKGYIEATAGQRESLDNFWFATIAATYRLTSKLNSKLSFGYNERNKETTALLIAGMVDNAKLSFNYQYTVKDNFNLTLNQNRYKSQDQVTLGSGQSAIAYYHHKFEFDYPDWNYTVFGSIHRYDHSGKLSPKAQEIIPGIQTADVSFYVPENFCRYGVSFGFGQDYLESYTHAWRPFAEVSVFNNTRFGLGSYMNAGVAGSVFGRDHLVLYYSRSVGIEASEQKDYMIGLSYNHYF
jgi:polysaccharide biosynthesis protein PelB